MSSASSVKTPGDDFGQFEAECGKESLAQSNQTDSDKNSDIGNKGEALPTYYSPRKRRRLLTPPGSQCLEPSSSPPTSLQRRSRRIPSAKPSAHKNSPPKKTAETAQTHLSPEAVFRTTQGDAVLAALRRMRAKSPLQMEHSPGSPLWTYINCAYFAETAHLRRDIANWRETVDAEAGRTDLCLDSECGDFQELETKWTEELTACCALSETLLNDLRRSVESATLPDPQSVAMSPSKQISKGIGTEDPWVSLLHSPRLYPLFPQLVVSVKQIVEPDDDIYCATCYDGFSCEDNLIVICSGCEGAFHTQCYGIKEVPEEDWYCEVCVEKSQSATCSVCGKTGGDLKKGRTQPVGGTGWAHVYCVESIPGGKFENPESKSMVDLSDVDPRRRHLICQFCEVHTGACLQCSYRSCLASFHPFCWKQALMVVNSPIDAGFECIRHKDSNSQQKLQRLEKYRIKELQYLYKELTCGKAAVPQKPRRVVVSKEDTRALVRVAKKALNVVNYRKRRLGFTVEVDFKARTAAVKSPVKWNLMSPEAFRTQCLSLPDRTAEESSRQYSAIYSKIKKRAKHSRTEFTLPDLKSLSADVLRSKSQRKPRQKVQKVRSTLVRIPLRYISECLDT